MPDLLIELFSEEIPARMQSQAAGDLKRLMTIGLSDAGLRYSAATAYVTPRRLALIVNGLPEKSPSVIEERRGPRIDAPEQAIVGFLRSTGLLRKDLKVQKHKKGKVFVAQIELSGRTTAEIVSEVLERTIRNFPWPKSMRWNTGSIKWVRPLHSILCILSDEVGTAVVPLTLDGIRSANTTYGHRFHAPAQINVKDFNDYSAKLKKAFVFINPRERGEIILQDAENQAFANGCELVKDDRLLMEVVGLVEWPVVLMGSIDKSFLELPSELLRTSMREHQKFFSLRNIKTGQIDRFITVANQDTEDKGKTIIAGNQKVLFARLSDAKFFWENDLHTITLNGMNSWTNKLSDMSFHNKLGSEADRVERLAKLSKKIAIALNADPVLAEQAARIVKADLCSQTVREFPDLQGVMGSYFSKRLNYHKEISLACQEHYAPLGPSDKVPNAPISVVVALAEKLDKLVSFWAIDEKPTGSKDPFALRRATLGIIRLLIENNLTLPLRNLFPESFHATNQDHLLNFFHDRLKIFLRSKNVRHDVVDAALAMPGSDDITLVVKRAKALGTFLQSEDGNNLLRAFKRANNILVQAEEKDGVEYSFAGNDKIVETCVEQTLFRALRAETPNIIEALKMDDFKVAMKHLASLRPYVDEFFEAVQINTENEKVRRNRLNLLSQIRMICLSVADLSLVEG